MIMIKKLQFLFTALLLTVGVTSAWAKIVWPDSIVQYKTTSAISEATNSWDTGYPKDGKTLAKIEANTNYKMWFLEEFTIQDMANVTSIAMPFTYNGGDTEDVNIYLWTSTYPGAGAEYDANFVSAVNTKIGESSNIFGTITSSNATLTITGSNLTTLKTAFGSAGSVTVKFLVYYGGSDASKKSAFYGGATTVASRRPHLEVSYSGVTKAIVNNTTKTGYDDLATAAKEASDDDVLLLYDDCFLTSRLLFKSGSGNVNNSVTFKAAEGKDVTIYRWTDFNDITFLCSYAKTITFDGSNSGASLTIDACNSAKADKVLFGNENSGTFSFKNVTVKNYDSAGPAVMQVNSGKTGSYVLENVTFEKCSPSTAIINSLTTYSEKIVLKGDLTFTNCTGTHISLAKYMKEDSFTPTAAITLAWSETRADNTEVVSNANEANLSKYLLSDGWQLFYDSGSMKMKYDPEALVGETYYSRLSDAIADAAESSTVKILRDMTIPARLQITKTLTIEPNAANITVAVPGTFTGDYNAIEMATADKTLTIGSDTYAMTIDGQKTSLGNTTVNESTVYRKLIECTKGQIDLKNLTIKDVYTSCNQGIVCGKSDGVINLSDVVFDGCRSDHASQPCIVFCGKNDGIVLKNNNQFTNCTADLEGTYKNCNIFLEKRVRIDASISNTTPIQLYANESYIKLGNPVATQSLPTDEARFFILNKNYACYSKSNGSSRADLTVCEGKTLEISDAGAATFVLPFAATIPEDVTCYTLHYTTGNSKVVASEVTEGTLAAETPVLVNAAKGSYKFKNSSNATTATSIPGSPSVSGALTGVYVQTYVPVNSYILYKDNTNELGFYKVTTENSNYVAANRAYLTADDGLSRLAISFNEDETTGIDSVVSQETKVTDNVYYNINGQRVASPRKGLYIVNGKKVFIK